MQLKRNYRIRTGHEDTKVLHKLSKLHKRNDRHNPNWYKPYKPYKQYIICVSLIQETLSVKKQIQEDIALLLLSKTRNDFFCSGIQFYVLLSPYLCSISFLYLISYVLGDDAWISLGVFVQ